MAGLAKVLYFMLLMQKQGRDWGGGWKGPIFNIQDLLEQLFPSLVPVGRVGYRFAIRERQQFRQSARGFVAGHKYRTYLLAQQKTSYGLGSIRAKAIQRSRFIFLA